MDRVGKIAGVLLMSNTMAKKAHLAAQGSGAYAAHVALGGFYDTLTGLTDQLVEAYQGKYGICDIESVDEKGDILDPVAMLETHLKMYQNLARSLDDRYLQNISDSIEECYYSTLYKLKFLK